MIRLVRCIKRRSDISAEEFRRFWNDPEYLALTDQVVSATNAVRCARNLTLQVELNRTLAEFHDQDEPYDGVIEIWWENAQLLNAAIAEQNAGEMQLRYNGFEDDYIDRPASRFFFTESN
jgi:hypothetical protein